MTPSLLEIVVACSRLFVIGAYVGRACILHAFPTGEQGGECDCCRKSKVSQYPCQFVGQQLSLSLATAVVRHWQPGLYFSFLGANEITLTHLADFVERSRPIEPAGHWPLLCR